MTTTRRALTALALAGGALLAGCSDEQQELRGWMDEQRRSMPATRESVSPPKRFEPFRYENAGQSDPFSPAKLALKGGPPVSNGIKPDLNRRREALEGYPLESIRMVGHMTSGRSAFALLEADKMVYQARVGNYAGQNFGMITRVTESEVVLRELVQDAAGDWVERDTSLRLQESKQETKK
jgi:type IV pilus assembly protein PilP